MIRGLGFVVPAVPAASPAFAHVDATASFTAGVAHPCPSSTTSR